MFTKETIAEFISDFELNDPEGTRIVMGEMGDGFYIQLKCTTVCNRSKVPYDSSGRKWYVSKHAAKNEVAGTLLEAYKRWLAHEARERLRYKGETIFDPHTSLEGLLEACQKLETRTANVNQFVKDNTKYG